MQGSATIRVFCLPYTGELLKQSMHLWKVSPPGNVKKAEHRLRLCRQFAIALSSGRTEHCATWRAYCCSRHSLALVLVFMCEKHFLTQRQEPNATWRHVTHTMGVFSVSLWSRPSHRIA